MLHLRCILRRAVNKTTGHSNCDQAASPSTRQKCPFEWWGDLVHSSLAPHAGLLLTRRGTGSLGQLVIWVIFHVWVTGTSFWPGVRPEFFRFSKKCPKCKTYIWNAEMTNVRCLLLDWNHWMSVHAMNFYFYLRLLENSLDWEYFFTHVDMWSSL